MIRVWNRKQDREDYRSAAIRATLAEINRDRDKKHEPFTALDFMTLREPGDAAEVAEMSKVEAEKLNNRAIAFLHEFTSALGTVSFGERIGGD